jgi:hypothetical protein
MRQDSWPPPVQDSYPLPPSSSALGAGCCMQAADEPRIKAISRLPKNACIVNHQMKQKRRGAGPFPCRGVFCGIGCYCPSFLGMGPAGETGYVHVDGSIALPSWRFGREYEEYSRGWMVDNQGKCDSRQCNNSQVYSWPSVGLLLGSPTVYVTYSL